MASKRVRLYTLDPLCKDLFALNYSVKGSNKTMFFKDLGERKITPVDETNNDMALNMAAMIKRRFFKEVVAA